MELWDPEADAPFRMNNAAISKSCPKKPDPSSPSEGNATLSSANNHNQASPRVPTVVHSVQLGHRDISVSFPSVLTITGRMLHLLALTIGESFPPHCLATFQLMRSSKRFR